MLGTKADLMKERDEMLAKLKTSFDRTYYIDRIGQYQKKQFQKKSTMTDNKIVKIGFYMVRFIFH